MSAIELQSAVQPVEDRSRLSNKVLVSNPLWDRLVTRVQQDEGVEHELAERIMDQALAFLKLCGREPDGDYSPSPLVDVGWHTFILYTREYGAFCERLTGTFVHHEPSDVPGVDYGTGNVGRTVVAMKRLGIVVDESVWLNASASCSSYCSGDSCSGGGGDGDPGCKHVSKCSSHCRNTCTH